MSGVFDQVSTLDQLDALAAEGRVHGLTIWKAQGGYQVSLRTEENGGFRVMRKPTPSEGIAAVLAMDWMDDGHSEGSKPRELVDFGEAAIADLVGEDGTAAIDWDEIAEERLGQSPPSNPGLFD